MSPCSPNDVSFDIPSGPSGPAIPGYGVPYALRLPENIKPPEGFPENLNDILEKLSMIFPSGILKPALNRNFGKDIFDSIMKLLDHVMPFLMLYKFFIPLLGIIICIIEVLCALKNPFKLIRAIKRLFRKCIPDFLNLFPIFSLISIIISILLLLVALIEYIINELIKLIELILRNLRNLYGVATAIANENSILAIANKIGSLLCVFQNLFVLLSIFNIVFDIIREMLDLLFTLPPCDDTDSSDLDGCCTPDVCPEVAKTSVQRNTGKIQYYNQLTYRAIGSIVTQDVRKESWQIFDTEQYIQERFINITDAYDIPQTDLDGNVINTPKPIFFPTDAVYTAQSAPKQVAYTMDLRLYYNPINWGRYNISDGKPRYIQFKDCIVLTIPYKYLGSYTGTTDYTTEISNGILKLEGGLGFENDGTTPLKEYLSDGITQGVNQATLNTFLHKAQIFSDNPTPQVTDGYLFENMEYIFKPNFQVLMDKNLVTSACETGLAFEKQFINNVFAGDIGVKTPQLQDIFKKENNFPDPNAAQECLLAAIAGLRSNLTFEGVSEFQSISTVCLEKIKEDTNNALTKMIVLGVDPCKSTFSLDVNKQFTTKPIKITVNINERNGFSIISKLSETVAKSLINKIKSHSTFGEVTNFSYENNTFTANITSKEPGQGKIMISFDDNIFCTNYLPDDIDEEPTHTLQELDYQFVYAPAASGVVFDSGVLTSSGDETGQPRRDNSDKARDNR